MKADVTEVAARAAVAARALAARIAARTGWDQEDIQRWMDDKTGGWASMPPTELQDIHEIGLSYLAARYGDAPSFGDALKRCQDEDPENDQIVEFLEQRDKEAGTHEG